MYIAVLADNVADRKQAERLLGRANDSLANDTGTLYVDAYGDASSLLRAPMKYELFIIDISLGEEFNREVIEALHQVHAPGLIAICHPEGQIPSYVQEYNRVVTLDKPIYTEPLHQLIKMAHKEQVSALVPKIEIRSETETYYVPLENILYAEEKDHYVYVHLADGSTISMLGTIDDFYRWVDTHEEFEIIKKDTVVNLNHVYMKNKREYRFNNGTVIALPRFTFNDLF